ncbi:MAG: YceI family protein [Bacteroidota bacterium]|nr:YceI family protein [Bacteroidota bacterium]MDP3147044.1 YceI family protein [Bacteroidota bacterium]
MNVLFINCRKIDSVSPIESSLVTGTGSVDVSWTFDKAHSNVTWESKYLDWSAGMLNGRFNNFNFNPKFIFNQSDLSKCSISAWVQLSSIDSGEPGRDGIGKCIRSYMGITYLDSMKTITNPNSDSAWFNSSSFVKSGSGYVVFGNLRFNKYRAPSGFPDGTPIIKPAIMYLVYNGTNDFDNNGDQVNDRYRASFSAKLKFKRSDFIDTKSTVQWVPVPTLADQTGNISAANNKTYGVWTTNIADEMSFSFNAQFYKNH